MIVSYKWLSEYLPIGQPGLPDGIEPEKLSKILTSIGLEVENMKAFSSIEGGLKNIVIGKILTCEKHPDADKLKLTTVDTGSDKPLQIVCGAPNAEAGQYVIVALVGATLYPITGEPFLIKKAKIRGVESQGMICAEDEIGVGNSHAGIIVLQGEFIVGTSASELYNVQEDFIYEIGLTPNRMDAMSHIGVARDVCSWLSHHYKKDITIQLPYKNNFKADNNKTTITVSIENPVACLRYSGVNITNITVSDSPDWLKEKLTSIGVKSINNIVDITNFILHETGQPLHAFDADKIKGNEVIIKNAVAGSLFVTLDDKKHILHEDDLMICNTSEPMCIAGVYGGFESGVTNTTKNIFLESACFQPQSIRKTSLRHGLRTDAATRFEKGTDISQTATVLRRAALLIKEITGGDISGNIIDLYPSPAEKKCIGLKFHYLKKLSGKNYHGETVKNILQSLGFDLVKESSDEIWVNVPFSKPDITIPADLVEEIMRIDGLDNIEIPSSISISPSVNQHAKSSALKENTSSMLVGIGFREIFTNSITNSAYYNEVQLQTAVKMLNSLSAELNIMRPSMLHTGLESVAYNINRKNADIRFFEFGKIYNRLGSGYSQQNQLCLYISGQVTVSSWNNKPANADFYYLKGICEKILISTGIKNISIEITEDGNVEMGINLKYKKKVVGSAGMVNTNVLKKFNIKQPVFFASLLWDEINELAVENKITYTELSKYPSVQRDLALVVNKDLKYEAVEKVIRSANINNLKQVNLFDVFESEKLGIDKKSMAINFTFMDPAKTLTDHETDAMMKKLAESFEKHLNAEIRK
ncbi:MAG: phenylalanine--tRNA ligase subunit beta [Ferruginibacter sp.]